MKLDTDYKIAVTGEFLVCKSKVVQDMFSSYLNERWLRYVVSCEMCQLKAIELKRNWNSEF